jgi:vitamin-K-epoxide reductase (warfarin-sensitive)
MHEKLYIKLQNLLVLSTKYKVYRMLLVAFLAIIGLFISLYSYYIERLLKENINYKPICDISSRISCTKPLKSKYRNLFLLSNSLVGIIYYVAIVLLALLNLECMLFYLSLAGIVASIVLIYILLVKIKSLCLVCFSIHAINALIFICMLMK